MKAAIALTLSIAAFLAAGWLAPAAHAGQLVSAELKQWAEQAIRQEKQLSAVIKPRSVAVLAFRNRSDRPELDPLQKGFAVMLISDLAKLDVVTVIERAELQALVEELGLGRSGLVDAATAPRIGRLVQAEHIVEGALTPVSGDRFAVSADVVKVIPGKSAGRVQAVGSIETLLEIEKQLLYQLVHLLQLEPTAQQMSALRRPLSRDTAALMDFFTGIDAGDRGRFDQARQLFARASRRDPDFALAKTALLEIDTRRQGHTMASGAASADNTTGGESPDTAQRRNLLHSMRQRTSFTTRLRPATPVARIHVPLDVNDQRYTPPGNDVYTPPVGSNPLPDTPAAAIDTNPASPVAE